YTGQLLGTYDYLAPEQARDARKIDARADLYSLGCTSYFLLTAIKPFGRSSAINTLLAHQLDTAPAMETINPEVPLNLARWVRRMMARDPNERFQTVDESIQAFDAIVRTLDLPSPAEENNSQQSTERPESKRSDRSLRSDSSQLSQRRWQRWAAGMLAIAALLLASLTVLLRVTTPHGEIVVAIGSGVDPNDFTVVATKQAAGEGPASVFVADKANHWKIDVREGRYNVELRGGKDSLRLDQDRVVVSRGETVRLVVSHSPSLPTKPPPNLVDAASPTGRSHSGALSSADASAARWVLSIGGTVRINGQSRDIRSEEDLPSDFYTLTSVYLPSETLKPESLKNLRNLPALSKVIMGKTGCETRPIGGQFVDQLQTIALPRLSTLYLYNIELNATDCAKITALQPSVIHITDRSLTSECVAELAKNPKMVQLSINTLGQQTINLQSLEHADRLVYLYLYDLKLNEGALMGAKWKSRIKRLLLNNIVVSPTDIHAVARYPSLNELTLAQLRAPIFTDEFIAGLSSLHLSALRFPGTKSFNDGTLRRFLPLTDLKHLDIRNTGVTVDATSILQNWEHLESLSLPKKLQSQSEEIQKLRQALPNCQIDFG
ncbi:MAG: hypothetical protein AAFP69_16115, partial [Planctomycetota bacterium]